MVVLTLVQIRAIIEIMDGTVQWDEGEERIELDALGSNVVMWIGDECILANGESMNIDVPPQTINDRTMLPIRFVAENIGCRIAWIESTEEVVIVF